jgi:hypothetical protein
VTRDEVQAVLQALDPSDMAVHKAVAELGAALAQAERDRRRAVLDMLDPDGGTPEEEEYEGPAPTKE